MCDVYTWKLLRLDAGLSRRQTQIALHELLGPLLTTTTDENTVKQGVKMSKILAYTSPALGHLFPMTPLLLELRSRGHQVHVRTLADQVERMESLGLEASAMDPRIEAIENVDWKAGNARAALASVVATFVARGEYDAPDLEQAIAEQRPDLLIVDINAWGASGGRRGIGSAVRHLQPVHAADPVHGHTALRARVQAAARAARDGSATDCSGPW